MITFVGHLVIRRIEQFACLCFTCIFDIVYFVYSSTLSFPQFFAITKLNGTNYKNEVFDNHWVNVCFESNIIDVSSDTW